MKNLKLTVQKTCLFIFLILSIVLHSGCEAVTQPARAESPVVTPTAAVDVKAPEPESPVSTVKADAATILARTEVPVLCYHQVRDYKASDSKTAKDYIVPVASFREQMQALADSGYQAILPDQLYEYLISGKQLPARPVLITFDDTRLDQYTEALPELNKHGFKGAFFIMTVSLGKPGYMSREQVKQLADQGHTIGSHTYDHKNVKTYTVDDWVEQVQQPSIQLQTITGKPVEYFAYPFGLWNKEAIAKIKDHDFKAVFQLSAKRDENDPLFCIRRIIVPGNWSGATMVKVMQRSFK
jgi:peptidoglycan/xylan/chitin deacetylase (PgdA/CDA1 family)